MEKLILVINIGSSSKKYHLYSGNNLLLSAHFEAIKGYFIVNFTGENESKLSSIKYEKSLINFLEKAEEKNLINQKQKINAIGIRIVAPGTYFTKDRIVNKAFLAKLDLVEKKDVIHIDPIEKEISLIRKTLPKIKIVAVSDSAFHANRPKVSLMYAIPEMLAKKNDIYRFGYHGISIGSIMNTLKVKITTLPKRIIVCHLGSGSSVTALLNGKSVDTSMGYSPLEGLVMSSRVGNIDAEAVLRLAEEEKIEEMQKLFYSKSGLLALSDLSGDMRVLLEAEKEGNKKAHLAIEAFLYSIRKYIGAYSAILGGIDALVFSGTIGERSEVLRGRICENLEFLNIKIDSKKNKKVMLFKEISRSKSTKIYVVHSNENQEILRIARKMT